MRDVIIYQNHQKKDFWRSVGYVLLFLHSRYRPANSEICQTREYLVIFENSSDFENQTIYRGYPSHLFFNSLEELYLLHLMDHISFCVYDPKGIWSIYRIWFSENLFLECLNLEILKPRNPKYQKLIHKIPKPQNFGNSELENYFLFI